LQAATQDPETPLDDKESQESQESQGTRQSLYTLIAATEQVEMPTGIMDASTTVPSVLQRTESMDPWVPVETVHRSFHQDRWINNSQSRFDDCNQINHHLNLEEQLEPLHQQDLHQLLLQNEMGQETQPACFNIDQDHRIPNLLNLDEQLELFEQRDLQQLFLQNHMHPLVAEPQPTSPTFGQQTYGSLITTQSKFDLTQTLRSK
jgi:hypothetical protein